MAFENFMYGNKEVKAKDILTMAINIALSEDDDSMDEGAKGGVIKCLFNAYVELQTHEDDMTDGANLKLLNMADAHALFLKCYDSVRSLDRGDVYLPDYCQGYTKGAERIPRKFIIIVAKAQAQRDRARMKAWAEYLESDEGKAQADSFVEQAMADLAE